MELFSRAPQASGEAGTIHGPKSRFCAQIGQPLALSYLGRSSGRGDLAFQLRDGVDDNLKAAAGMVIEEVDDPLDILERLRRTGVGSQVLQVLPHH